MRFSALAAYILGGRPNLRISRCITNAGVHETSEPAANCVSLKVNGFRTERADGERFSDHNRRLAAIARTVEADQRLNAEMSEWEATIGDGLDGVG